MDKSRNFNKKVKDLKCDIRLEVVLCELLQSDGLRFEEIIVVNNSLFKRNFHKDLEEIEERQFGPSRISRVSFIVNRNGIYDNLPEDIFHQLSGLQGAGLEDIAQQQEVEKSARSFFLPYEQEFYRQRIKLEFEERNFLFETNSHISGDLLNNLWNFPDIFSSLQKTKLGVLMPVLHKVVGNYELVRFVIENISETSVDIDEFPPATVYLESQCIINDSLLGINSILGGILTGMQYSVSLNILIENIESLLDYLPNGKMDKIFKFLSDLLFPFDVDVSLQLLIHQRNRQQFTIDDDREFTGRLNYTTLI